MPEVTRRAEDLRRMVRRHQGKMEMQNLLRRQPAGKGRLAN
jgi:hypothetical protein